MNQELVMFFNKNPEALPLYETFEEKVLREIEDVSIRVQKTQISFSNTHLFAAVSFLPVRKAKDRPKAYIVVTFGLGYKKESPRIDAASEPYPGRWTHHMMVTEEEEIDQELMGWVKEAAVFAAEKGRSKKSARDNRGDAAGKGKIAMALIGTGSMGRRYAQMMDEGKIPHMKLTALCCRSEEACQWAHHTLSGQAVICRSAEELYKHPELYDGVLIVTPHDSHKELSLKAFELGKHVFCDKPSGLSVEEARQMNEAALSCGRQFAIMFHQRLYAKHRRIREIIEGGELGKLQRISMKNTEPFRTQAYHNSSSWHSTWAGEGGGALINQGQHLLDLWQWLFGMPKQVCANMIFGKYNDFSVDDEAEILMKYDDGVTGSFFLSTGEARSEERLEVIGSRASLLMEGDTVTICRYSQDSLEYGRESKYRTREGLRLEEVVQVCPTKKDYEQMLENFAMAVLDNEPLIAPGQEGYKALELANSAYLSAWLERPVSLPLDCGMYEAELRKRIEWEEKGLSVYGAGRQDFSAAHEDRWETAASDGEKPGGIKSPAAEAGGGKASLAVETGKEAASSAFGHGFVRVTTLCYLEREGQYLMLHRTAKEKDENKDKWIGVGGHVEEGESPEDCLIREVREETGLTLTSYRFRGVVTFVSDQWGIEYMCLYTADRWAGKMTECREGTLKWVDKDKLCTLKLWEGDKIFLRLLKKDAPFFSLKLRYEGDCLKEAVLDGNMI